MFPPLDPLGDPNSLDLGVGPAPTAPTAPTLGESPDAAKKRRLMQIVATALAAGLGPGRGTGILQGVAQHQALSQREQQIKDQQAAQLYQQQHQDYRTEQQQYEQEQNRRQQLVATNLDKLRTIAPTLKSKDEYDRYVDAFATGLQGMGVRVNPNYLRTAAPFVPPDGRKAAASAVDSFLKNPVNKELIGDPERLKTIKLRYDSDGDGIEEDVFFHDAAERGGVQFGRNPDGSIATYPSGTSKDQKANADGILQTLIEQAKAEGKRITPELTLQLQATAIKKAKEAGDLGPDPTLEAIRQLTLQKAKDGGGGDLSLSQKLTAEERLATKWRVATTSQREMQRQFSLMQTGLKRFRQGDPNGGSQGVLVTFQKILDPTSVVRESEYARTAVGQSFLSRIEGFEQKLASGGAGMTDKELAAMVETARQFLGNMQNFNAGERRRIETQVGTYGLNPAGVFNDMPESASDQPGSATPAPAGGALPSYQEYLQRKGGQP